MAAQPLNVQVVPGVPQWIKSGLTGQLVMSPEWIQYFRSVNDRIGGANEQLISQSGAANSLALTPGVGVGVAYSGNQAILSSSLTFTTVGGSGIAITEPSPGNFVFTNTGVLDFASTVSGLDPIVAENGHVVLSGVLNIDGGGTGHTTAQTAFDALSPLTTIGDLIAFDGSNNVRLPVGADGQVLTADSTQPDGLSWTLPNSETPYYIPPTEQFTVNVNKQVLFEEDIEVDGILEIDGHLLDQTDPPGPMPTYIHTAGIYRVLAETQILFGYPFTVDGILEVDGILLEVA